MFVYTRDAAGADRWMSSTLEWCPFRGMFVRPAEYWVKTPGCFARFVPDVTLRRGTRAQEE